MRNASPSHPRLPIGSEFSPVYIPVVKETSPSPFSNRGIPCGKWRIESPLPYPLESHTPHLNPDTYPYKYRISASKRPFHSVTYSREKPSFARTRGRSCGARLNAAEMEGDATGADGGGGGGSGERSSFVIGLIENRAKEVSHALKPLRIFPVARSIRADFVNFSSDPVILRPASSVFVIRVRVEALQLCELLFRRIACFDWFANAVASLNCLL